MATDSNILREYLVSLGFKVDGAQATAFDKNLKVWDARATTLAKTVFSVGAAVQAMVTVFAFQMEKLYYSSQRTKAAVGNIQALEYAGTRIGLSGGKMTQALEGMAKALRMNPAIKGVIEAMGVKVTGRDSSDVMKDVLSYARQLPHFIGARMMESWFGMDEETFTQIKNNWQELQQSQAASLDVWKTLGVNQQEAAEAGKNYANSWREILMYADGFKGALSIALLPMMQEMANVTKLVLQDWTKIVQETQRGEGFWNRMRDGLRAKLGLAPLRPDGSVASNLTEDARHRIKMAERDGGLNTGGASGSWDAPGASPTPPGGSAPSAATDARLPLGLRQHNPGNLRSWGDSSRANGFAQFGTDEEGLSAMAGQLLRYNERGLDTIRKIISTYAPPGENDTGGYVNTISRKLGVNADSALNLKDSSTLMSLMAAMIQQEQGRNPFGRAQLEGAVSSRGVSIQQKTDIHVAAGATANETAQAVANEQKDVNADIVRNNRGAIQ